MKKTIYLHVGPHKTGTTVIQKACLDNREVLDKYDVSYPSLFFNHIGHHDLVNTVRLREISDKHLGQLEAINSNILLSSENFIHFTQQDLQYLVGRFSKFDIKIIYSWRRSSLKMYSMWQESIKHGEVASFHSFYYSDLVRPGQSKTLMQTLNVELLASKFGKDNLYILDFDSLSESNNLVKEFFDIVGVKGSEIDISTQSDGVRNESLDPRKTEMLRGLNALSKGLGLPVSSKTREAFSMHYDTIIQEVEQVLSLMERYIENVEVGNYLIDRSSEAGITQKFMPNIRHYQNKNRVKIIKIVNSDWLLNPLASQLLAEIHKKIMGEVTQA
ncbi:hypothetical protein RCJ22_14235 [Vibrio sp. FNV 38]|nr:hypothetical protein [Vibrio sp. FNV 38]